MATSIRPIISPCIGLISRMNSFFHVFVLITLTRPTQGGAICIKRWWRHSMAATTRPMLLLPMLMNLPPELRLGHRIRCHLRARGLWKREPHHRLPLPHHRQPAPERRPAGMWLRCHRRKADGRAVSARHPRARAPRSRQRPSLVAGGAQPLGRGRRAHRESAGGGGG